MNFLLILAASLCLWGVFICAVCQIPLVVAFFAIGLMGCFWRSDK